MPLANAALGSPPKSFRSPLRLGGLTLPSPAIQAALSGFSDLPMRRVARAFGACYAIHEVILDQILLRPGKLQRELLRVHDDDHPVGGQLMGASPEGFAEAAGLLVGAGYDVIDINFGCPVKKVLGRSRGGFLLSEPDTALAILHRVRDAVPAGVPLTVKMRRGMDDEAHSADNFWRILEGAFALGVDAVAVHGRTVRQRYVGPSSWPFLAEVKRRYPTKTILGSGDLFTALDAVRMLEQTGVDGVWLARGSIGAPWIFGQVDRLLATGDRGPPPTLEEQARAVTLHFEEAVRQHGAARGSRVFRKAGIQYSQAHPLGLEVRDAFIACKGPEDAEAVLARYYDPRRDYGTVEHSDGRELIAAGAS
jgi:tRNA-dihydrouridine synthase B